MSLEKCAVQLGVELLVMDERFTCRRSCEYEYRFAEYEYEYE